MTKVLPFRVKRAPPPATQPKAADWLDQPSGLQVTVTVTTPKGSPDADAPPRPRSE